MMARRSGVTPEFERGCQDREEPGALSFPQCWPSASRSGVPVSAKYVAVSCWAWATAEMGRLFKDLLGLGNDEDSLFC